MNQYALLPAYPPMEKTFIRQVQNAIVKFKSFPDLQEADIECSEGDLWHLSKVTDPSMRFGTNPIGQAILLKVFELMPQEGLLLSQDMEAVLAEALNAGTDTHTYEGPNDAALA